MAKSNGPIAESGAAKRSSAAKGGAAKPAASTKGETGGAAPSRTSSKPASSTKPARGASSTGGSGRGGSGGAGDRKAAAGKRTATDLRKDLRGFASTRPQGWSHDDWLHFLDDLQSRGHNINDRDAIGSMLERERLALALEKIPGVGPQRVRSIADRYGYLWRLKETDADQLAREAAVPKAVAEKVVAALRS